MKFACIDFDMWATLSTGSIHLGQHLGFEFIPARQIGRSYSYGVLRSYGPYRGAERNVTRNLPIRNRNVTRTVTRNPR